MNLIRNPELTTAVDWARRGTFTAQTVGARVQGTASGTAWLASNHAGEISAISGPWTHNTAPEPGREYLATCRFAAINDAVFAAKPVEALVQLRLGTVVFATVTILSTSITEPVTPAEVRGTVPADYVFNGSNGINLYVQAKPPAGASYEPRVLLAEPFMDVAPAPEPEPEPDPGTEEPAPTGAAGPLVAAFLGRPGDPATETQAAAHALIVTEYVRGYTRGRGFINGSPSAPLLAVIVSSTARLTPNPEQVTYYQTGDYSERPAILAGWTLPELAVLNGFRRRSA